MAAGLAGTTAFAMSASSDEPVATRPEFADVLALREREVARPAHVDGDTNRLPPPDTLEHVDQEPRALLLGGGDHAVERVTRCERHGDRTQDLAPVQYLGHLVDRDGDLALATHHLPE